MKIQTWYYALLVITAQSFCAQSKKEEVKYLGVCRNRNLFCIHLIDTNESNNS